MNIKVTLLIAFLISTFSVIAQDFPGKHANLLKDKELKVKDLHQTFREFGYKNFYTDEKMSYNSVYADKTFSSRYESLVGKTFKVIEITPNGNNYDGFPKFKLKLDNPEIGTLYFDYDSVFEDDYHFEVIGGLILPAGFYCEDLETEKDKFTGEITTRSPYESGISFIKVTKKGISTIYMAVNEHGSTLNVGKKGLTILLKNGKKFLKPTAKLDVEVGSSSGYVYSAFVQLTPQDIKLLTGSIMTDTRLYIYDGKIDNGQKLREYLKCLIKK